MSKLNFKYFIDFKFAQISKPDPHWLTLYQQFKRYLNFLTQNNNLNTLKRIICVLAWGKHLLNFLLSQLNDSLPFCAPDLWPQLTKPASSSLETLPIWFLWYGILYTSGCTFCVFFTSPSVLGPCFSYHTWYFRKMPIQIASVKKIYLYRIGDSLSGKLTQSERPSK